MNKLFCAKNRNIIIVDLFIILMTIIVLILNIKFPTILNNNFTLDNYVYTIALPLFIVALIGLTFGLFAEYKFNKLCFKNIILLFLGIIFLNNLLMNIIMPSHFVLVTYNNVQYTMDVSVAQRLFSIINCASVCLGAYLLMFVIPKLLYTKRFIKFFLFVFIAFVLVVVVSSFITDFESYKLIIKSGFTDFSKPVSSFLKSKYYFSLIMLIGIVASTVMERITKKKRFIIFAILFFIINIFSFSKLPILLSLLYLIVYLCIFLKPVIFKNKDNKLIALACLTFVVCIVTTLSIMMAFSQTGLLYKIKSIFSNVIQSAKSTFSTRMTIWESAFKTLKPYQFIFGFGFYLGDIALNLSYSHNPHLAEDPTHIGHCHNAYIECIQLGGIIYLLFYLFLLVTLIRYVLKVRKRYKDVSTLMLALIGYVVLNGIVDSFILFYDPIYMIFSIFFSLLVMGFYYYSYDEKELLRKRELLKDAINFKINQNDNFFNRLNKKINLFVVNDIKSDKELIKRINNYNIN